MGTRYLDPKYSRWISTDPALSSYRDPSKVPAFDETGKPNRFKFHVAPTVNINGKKYVVDPFYHKSWYSISEQDDWYSCRYFEN